MKTIEQASENYALSLEDNDYTIETKAAFQAGVEFAQRWISFDEEIPPIHTWLTVKINDYYGTINTKYLDSEDFLKEKFTHWRLINLK